MKRFSSLFLILFISCSGLNQVEGNTFVEENTSTTIQFNGVSTTTTEVVETTTTTEVLETTTTTINDVAREIVSNIKIEILNCPSEKVDIAVGELFEIKFSVQAGSADIISIFYLFELNDEYYSRLPLDRESHSDLFNFPSADQKIYSSTYVEKLADGDEYWVTIEILDEDSFFSYDLCVVKF